MLNPVSTDVFSGGLLKLTAIIIPHNLRQPSGFASLHTINSTHHPLPYITSAQAALRKIHSKRCNVWQCTGASHRDYT